MEYYKMSDVWKMKLEEEMMILESMNEDKNVSEEDKHDILVIIDYIKAELEKAISEENDERRGLK